MGKSLQVGGIVLCGGKSNRMGFSKAMLPFGSELMLQRVVRVLSEVVDPIVVVAAADQHLPQLPEGVIVTRDERECQGPLEGLRTGIVALEGRAKAVYATSCDVPLLSVEFVRAMIARLGGQDVAVPVDGEFYHPLAAIYRTNTAGVMKQLLDRKNRRTSELFALVSTNRVPVGELRNIDPELLALLNVNTPDEYARALAIAEISIESSLKTQLGL